MEVELIEGAVTQGLDAPQWGTRAVALRRQGGGRYLRRATSCRTGGEWHLHPQASRDIERFGITEARHR